MPLIAEFERQRPAWPTERVQKKKETKSSRPDKVEHTHNPCIQEQNARGLTLNLRATWAKSDHKAVWVREKPSLQSGEGGAEKRCCASAVKKP